MLTAMHPTYTLKIEVKDASRVSDGAAGGLSFVQNPGSPYRFYGAFGEKTGCDDALKAVKDALKAAGIPATVTLERFEHKA